LETGGKMTTAIILAAGRGERFANDTPKQFAKLAGLPVVVHTLKVFQRNKSIHKVVVVTNKNNIEKIWEYVRKYDLSKVCKVCAGGQTRQESCYIGLMCCPEKTDYVLIHDAVRPFVDDRIIFDLISAVKKYRAVDTAIPSADTIIKINDCNFIEEIPDRNYLRRGQTPQAFEYNLIFDAHKKAIEDGIKNATDDCSLVLRLNKPVYVVNGDEHNIKITYPIDMHIADKLFQLKTTSFAGSAKNFSFTGKTVVIIGGTSGIGLSLAKLLQAKKAKVFKLSRHTEIKIDITSFESIQKAFDIILKKSGRIDILINCAGDLIRKDVVFTDEKEWDYIYNANIKGAFLLSKVLIPIFKRQGGGHLMFIGSSAYTRGRAGYAAYSSSKAALVNFTQALAEEVVDFGIKVNIINPSRVATPLRFKNFGEEDPKTLLKPDFVAEKIIEALSKDTTGSVFEIR